MNSPVFWQVKITFDRSYFDTFLAIVSRLQEGNSASISVAMTRVRNISCSGHSLEVMDLNPIWVNLRGAQIIVSVRFK